MCSGRVESSCSTSDIRRVNLVTNPVLCHQRVLLSINIVFSLECDLYEPFVNPMILKYSYCIQYDVAIYSEMHSV
jgi:hypothetical protein